MVKYDDLVNKHVMMEKELVALKRVSKSKANANKELITLKKKKRKETIIKKNMLEAEKQKNKLTNLSIEKERSLRA
jgi:hypothetical protein